MERSVDKRTIFFCLWCVVLCVVESGGRKDSRDYVQHSSEKIMSKETIIHALFLLPRKGRIYKKNESAKII